MTSPMRHSASVGGLLVGLTVGLTVAVTVALTGCSPALNWRDVRPEGSHAQLLFPCKPDVQERRVALAGPPVRLVLHVCSAADLTWAFAVADMAEPGRVGPALAALQAAAAANLGSAPGAITPQAVPGATPQPGSGRSHLRGQLSDGHGVQMQVLVFARGTQVFQASVLGAALPEEAVDTYFTSLRFPP